MKFEWDSAKANANLRKHGVAFEDAAAAFSDELSATFPDPDHSFGEARLITFAMHPSGELLVIAHTERRGVIRIISARRATKQERKRYES
jgi:uncharacterized protein